MCEKLLVINPNTIKSVLGYVFPPTYRQEERKLFDSTMLKLFCSCFSLEEDLIKRNMNNNKKKRNERFPINL